MEALTVVVVVSSSLLLLSTVIIILPGGLTPSTLALLSLFILLRKTKKNRERIPYQLSTYVPIFCFICVIVIIIIVWGWSYDHCKDDHDHHRHHYRQIRKRIDIHPHSYLSVMGLCGVSGYIPVIKIIITVILLLGWWWYGYNMRNIAIIIQAPSNIKLCYVWTRF